MSDILDLTATRLKVNRAKKHVHDLRMAVKPFIHSRPQKLIVEPDDDGIHELVKIKQVVEIPDDVYLICGDAIHNLRSSLDIMLCAMGTIVGVPDILKVEFPFAWSFDDFAKPRVQGKVEMLGPDVARWVAGLEPYRGGNDLLHALHVLDCSDKHRTLLPVYFGGTGFTLVENADGLFDKVPAPWCPVKKEMVIERRVAQTYPKNEIKWRMQVAFDEPNAVKNRPIIHVLEKLVKKVEEIVTDCERRFSATLPFDAQEV